MLNKERIKEAQNNVRSYLSDGLLKKINNQNPQIKHILINNCKESLKVAEILLNNNYSNLWTIVCSYYAMYYIVNSVLYQLGYKIGDKISHKITSDSLIVYVQNKLKDSLLEEYETAKEEALEIAGLRADEIIKSFDYERIKRGKFQYNMTEQAKYTKAKTSLERAKIFVFEMEKLT